MASKSGPSLVDVKYTTIKPQEKTGDYKTGDRCTFHLDPQEITYIDGKQSYIYVELENNSSFSNVSATSSPPTCLMPHIGIHGLFDRMTLRSLNGLELEDMDASDTYKALQSYTHDFDEFPGMAKVEGIAAHTPKPHNSCCNDPKVNAMFPPAFYNTTSKTLTGGTSYLPHSYCMPLPFGLMSAFQNEHKVFPNASFLGTKIENYFANAKHLLKEMAGRYTVNAGGGITERYIHGTDPVACDNIPTADPQNEVFITNMDTTANDWSPDDVIFRVGMPVTFNYTVGGADVSWSSLITAVSADEGTSTDQLRIVVADDLGKDGNVGDIENLTIQLGDITYNYTVNKVELRVLETIPSDPKAIDAAISKGINYMTYQLTKQSMPAGLKNQVINIPSSLTRAKSILLTHCVSNNIDVANVNSLVYPQMEDNLNSVRYQWQVRNTLTPNRSVLVSPTENQASDNTIWYLEMAKAMRPVNTVRALNDGLPIPFNDTGNYQDLQLPLVYPLLLAPVRNSYSLVNAEPQLRIENSTSAQVDARLYHIFINHVRTVRRVGDSLNVEL